MKKALIKSGLFYFLPVHSYLNSMNLQPKIHASFKTDRLSVMPLSSDLNLELLALETKTILSPEVTKALPSGWQNIDSNDKAAAWIEDRLGESIVLLIHSQDDADLLGFIFLYMDDDSTENSIVIRFGYLLREGNWGKGIGTEVMRGFIQWSKETNYIKSISGGVEKSNIGSIKVLEKVGFIKSNEETEDTLFYSYSF
ncbi:MAG: GNAT family N-acetyltransferase [Crocinitomicaceae bacterium]|nr:GNAT family N-acetyltransferase [Crocinitomicaceae bacterium]